MITVNPDQARGFWASLVRPKVTKRRKDGSLIVQAPCEWSNEHQALVPVNWTQTFHFLAQSTD